MSDHAPSNGDSGWYVDELVSTLVISGQRARLVELWSIVAVLPLDEVLVELNLDGARQRPLRPRRVTDVDVSGGETTDDDWPLSPVGRAVLGIRLPRMLEPGQAHQFDLLSGATRAGGLSRHAVAPPVPCRRLEFRVHFDPCAAPGFVTRIAENCERTPVNSLGEVSLRLTDAEPGRLYGLSW